MSKKNHSATPSSHRLFFFVAVCSVLGVVLGGTAGRAEIQQCMTDETPSHECLTQDPTVTVLEGMSGGLVAGAGAAIALTWQYWQRRDG